MPLHLPRRIDGPAAAAQLTRDLLRHHRDEVTLALYLDDLHLLVGTAILSVGWAQAGRLSARPVQAGAMAAPVARAPRNRSDGASMRSLLHAAGTGFA